MSEALVINSVTIDRTASNVTILRLKPFQKDGYPEFHFARRGITLGAPPDPWAAKSVTYTLNGTLRFSGSVETYLDHYLEHVGWVREYTALGGKKQADHIPVTDPQSLTDTCRFNVRPDDPDVIPSRQGRSVGQIVADVLEFSAHKTALAAAGLGKYSSNGAGAAATAVMSGGSVASYTVTAGGSGYGSAAPTVVISGGGGSGATGTAHLTAGVVTSVTLGAGGSGYTSPPVVILSTLPAATLTDLDTLTIIPPAEVTVIGERLLSALEGCALAWHPNHWLHIEPDGTIRFHDSRTFTPTTITLGSADRVNMPQLSRDWSNCYQRVVVRGWTRTQAYTLGILPLPGSSLADNGLAEDFGHDGLSNADAITDWVSTDYQSPTTPTGQATATANLTTGAVSSLSVGLQGYGYTTAPAVTISGGGGSGAVFVAHLTGDKVTSYTQTSGGSGYTSTPTVLVGPPGASAYDQGSCTMPSTTTVRVTSSNTGYHWPADYWDQTTTGVMGYVVLTSNSITGVSQHWGSPVSANTSLSPGGTSDLTITQPTGSTSYDSYQLFGLGSGAGNVWRKYKATDAGIAANLAAYFPYPVAYRNSQGTAATLTSTPIATIFHNGSSAPMGLTVDPSTGHFYLNKPSALLFSSNGTTAVPPDDVQIFAAVQNGTLTATYPPDSGGPVYSGSSNSVEGLSRTKTISCNEWRDFSNQANMDTFAQEMHGALSETVVEGSIPYESLTDAWLAPGLAFNVAGDTYTTGYESINAPCLSVDLQFHELDGYPTTFSMGLHVSTRRAPYSAAAFQRPSQTGQMPLAGAMFEGFGGLGAQAGMQTAGVLGGLANFASNSLDAAAAASQNLPQNLSDLGVATNPGQFMPNQGDFEALGIDITGGKGT